MSPSYERITRGRGREGQKAEYDKRDRDGAKNTSRQREAVGGKKRRKEKKKALKASGGRKKTKEQKRRERAFCRRCC